MRYRTIALLAATLIRIAVTPLTNTLPRRNKSAGTSKAPLSAPSKGASKGAANNVPKSPAPPRHGVRPARCPCCNRRGRGGKVRNAA